MSWLRKFFNKVLFEPVLDVFSFIGFGPDRHATEPTPAAEPDPPAASGLFTDAQVRAFSTHDVAALSTSALNSLNTAQFGLLSTLQISALTTAQINRLESDDFLALASAHITALSGDQVRALQPVQVGQLASAQVVGLEARDIEVMTPEQIAALSIGSLRAMTPAQLDAVFLVAHSAEQGVAKPLAATPFWDDVLACPQASLLPGDAHASWTTPPERGPGHTGLIDKRLLLDDEARCVPLI